MATPSPATALRTLERLRERRAPELVARRLAALQVLARGTLATASQVRRLHEALCFLRATPDAPATLRLVERMLAGFAARRDLRRHAAALASSGIAGTTLWYPFFWPTAAWLARRAPASLSFDRSDTVAGDSLAKLVPALARPVKAHALRESHQAGYAALDLLRGRRTDAAWLVERLKSRVADDTVREALWDLVNPSCNLAPGPGVPTRTQAHFALRPPVYRTADLRRGRPELRAEALRPPRGITALPPARATALIDLARGAMVTRSRDLDAIAHGNAQDVWWIDDADGLAFALIGVQPARRVTIPAIYGGLMLENGVPIGYLQADAVGASVALSFNTFETFRGGESAWVFARLVAALRAFLGAASFSIEPYQLGDGNDEGLDSGAWWFYFKLGFRPRTRRAQALAARELARMARRPGHRSTRATLQALARDPLFLDLESRPAPFVLPAAVGLAVARRIAPLDDAALTAAACAACGLRRAPRLSSAEREAWEAWLPLLACLDTRRWPAAERAALLPLVRAKAAPSERDYARRLRRVPQLLDALAALSRSGPRP
jgi:hypothetical protein